MIIIEYNKGLEGIDRRNARQIILDLGWGFKFNNVMKSEKMQQRSSSFYVTQTSPSTIYFIV